MEINHADNMRQVEELVQSRLVEAIKRHDLQRRTDRQNLILSYPYAKLERKHLDGAQLLPTREAMLDELPKNGIVSEIGVAHGDFSSEILKRCLPKKLHLVDAWEAERYSEGYQRVCDRFIAEIQSGLVQLNRGLSTDVLSTYPDNYFDIVYIDTVHDYRITSQELALCSSKVKTGGIIAGHDYTPGNLIDAYSYGVIQAVQEFCVNNDWRYLYLTCESHCYLSFALTSI